MGWAKFPPPTATAMATGAPCGTTPRFFEAAVPVSVALAALLSARSDWLLLARALACQ